MIPSKGKRRKKRKRDDEDHACDGVGNAQSNQAQMPAVFDYVTIGFNSTVRSLEAISKSSKPAVLRDADTDMQELDFMDFNLTAVFICRSILPDPVTASIPLLIATASLAQPQYPPIRLVQLSADVERQLAEALHQPRVGFVGFRIGMPNADVLLALVRATVGPVRVPWLNSSESPRYLPVQIESTETSISSKEKPNQTSGTPKQTHFKDKLHQTKSKARAS